MSKRRHLRRKLAAIPQNFFLWLGSAVVPLLSRRGEMRLARAIGRFLCRPGFRWYRYARTNVDLVYGATRSEEERERIVRDGGTLTLGKYACASVFHVTFRPCGSNHTIYTRLI